MVPYIIDNNTKSKIYFDQLISNNLIHKLTKNALILLTEAPTTSFTQWCSIKREAFGAAYKMSSSGYHPVKIWKSIIFQFVYIFAVLEKEGIYIEEMSLNDNFYIKDIHINPNSIGSWIYKIKDFEFYIPNYGYILMFDSKYLDITTDKPYKKYKILSKAFTDNGKLTYADIKKKIYKKMIQILDSSNFEHYAKINKINMIDPEISSLLKNITKYVNENSNNTNFSIEDIFTKNIYFASFLHNRIGTVLTKNEKDNLNPYIIPNIKKGELCVYRHTNNEYYWAMCVDINDQNFAKYYDIIYKENKQYTYKPRIVSFNIQSYFEKLLPESSGDMRYDGSYIFETYDLNNSVDYL